MSVSPVVNAVRHVLMVGVMLFIWLVLGMVYVDEFFQPFEPIALLLMPWKGLASIPLDAGLSDRLAIMQGLLESSGEVANYSLAAMVLSFGAFSVYLTFVYHQRQRKAQENKLLVLKNQEISRRNEFIRYISATIGHEFKNNLGRIKRRIDLLPDLAPEAAERITDNFEKLFADIDIFKKISDEREAGLIDFRSINLKTMLRTLAEQYGDLADISFQKNSDFGPPSIFASYTLLRTVFENLIDNSVKFKKPEQERAIIRISCSLDADGTRRYVSISFRDEGIGMDEQLADQCFYKGKSTSGGWGEGLYFAKYVVGLHAGRIRVGKEYTAKGAGAEFIVNLPYVEESLDV